MRGEGAGSEEQDAISTLLATEPYLWLTALLFFGIGDLATTTIGLRFEHVVEVGPLVAPIIEQDGLPAMVALKTLAFSACTTIWLHTPRPYNLGVSLGLAIFGLLITIWNLLILTTTI